MLESNPDLVKSLGALMGLITDGVSSQAPYTFKKGDEAHFNARVQVAISDLKKFEITELITLSYIAYIQEQWDNLFNLTMNTKNLEL